MRSGGAERPTGTNLFYRLRLLRLSVPRATRPWLLALWFLTGGYSAHAEESAGYLVQGRRPACVVVVPSDATPVELRAAQELREHVFQISGARLTQIDDRQLASTAGPYLSVGRTKLAAARLSEAQIAEWGDDGYAIWRADGNALLAGGARRGTLYAVYHFLETLGVRWFAPDFIVLPRVADVPLPAAASFVPSFDYRDQWWNNAATSEWLARQRINGSNGQNHTLPAELGGSVATLYGCHSFKDLVPPAEHFETHRTWFAVKENGARGSRHELCLTNPELREFVAQKVLADLRARGGQADYFWVSQNDGGRSGCFCENCLAERRQHGGDERWSANIISFVNFVAARVQPDFPRVRIKTLAYSYTQEPPERLPAAPNVSVEVCGNFRAGAGDPHRRLIQVWSKVCPNLSVYTYGGSNYGYWWPYPYVADLGLQCAWARESGVKSFYLQGTALGRGSGLVDLKAYVSARMAWDPTRDVRREIEEFCAAYYGPAGRFIVGYLDWYEQFLARHGMELDGGWGDTERWRGWTTAEAMQHCEGLFQEALAATRDQPIYQRHVRSAYLEVLWGGIMVEVRPQSDLMDKDLKLVDGANTRRAIEKAALFGEIMRENGYDKWSEVLPFEAAKYPH